MFSKMISFGNCSKTRVPSTSHQPCPQTRNYLQAVTYLGGGLARGTDVSARSGRRPWRSEKERARPSWPSSVRLGPPRIEGEGGKQLMVMKEREGGREKAGPRRAGLSFFTDDDEGRPCDRRRARRREAKASCPSRRNYVRAQKSEFVKKLIKTLEAIRNFSRPSAQL